MDYEKNWNRKKEKEKEIRVKIEWLQEEEVWVSAIWKKKHLKL